MPVSSSNVDGQAYALMVLTPIAPGQEAELRAYLEGLDRDPSPLARVPRTHFARWVIVCDWVNDPSQRKDDRLGCQFLVFTSNFDGPLDSYLDELCDGLAAESQQIWGRCIGCPPDATREQLKAYLLHNQIDTGFFYSAYPQAPLERVRRALRTRETMIALVLRAQAMEPADLQRAFVTEVAP